MQIKKKHLRRARHQDVLRLARYLGLRRGLDSMSQRQLASLIFWLLTRRDMRARGMTTNGW